MSTQPHNHQADDELDLTAVSLGHFERLAYRADGSQYIAYDEEAHQAWMDKWVEPSPDGKPQRVRQALGFRERSVGELELRVAIGGGDEHGRSRLP